MGKKKLNLKSHNLVPKHTKLSETEVKKLLEEHKITIKELPRILKNDATLVDLEVKSGDVIKIHRISKISGEAVYYRVVVNE